MLFDILFPFFGLTSLYLFMIYTSIGANAITIGVGVSILLVIVRQFLLLSENRRLLQKYLKNADELQSSQERYRLLFEHHPDAAYSFTLDGIVQSVNEKGAQILGKTKEDLIGHSLIDTIYVDYQETVKEHFNNAQKGIFKHYELPISNLGNEFYYLGVTHVPIKVDGEEIVCTPSVGFAYYPKDGECVQGLLNKADAAMYKNKRHSKAMYLLKSSRR